MSSSSGGIIRTMRDPWIDLPMHKVTEISIDCLPDGRWAWAVTQDDGLAVSGVEESGIFERAMLVASTAAMRLRAGPPASV